MTKMHIDSRLGTSKAQKANFRLTFRFLVKRSKIPLYICVVMAPTINMSKIVLQGILTFFPHKRNAKNREAHSISTSVVNMGGSNRCILKE